MISSVGAFPFQSDAPVILGFEEMVIAITLLTGRWQRVLSKGVSDRRKLLFKSLAVYDREHNAAEQIQERDEHINDNGCESADNGENRRSHAPGFTVDEAGDDDVDCDTQSLEDDDLVLSALDTLHIDEAFKVGNKETIHGAMIPSDNFRRILTLLLLIAPVGPQERLSQYTVDVEPLRAAADSILSAFLNVEKSPGIKYKAFSRVMDLLPHMLDPLNALFEHFLFSKNLDFTKHKNEHSQPSTSHAPQPLPPLLPQTASILNHATLSQLSFFLGGSTLFRRLRLLYSGDRDGFSMVSLFGLLPFVQIPHR